MGVYHSFEKMKPQLCFFLKNLLWLKYSCLSMCVCVSVCVAVFVHDNSKNNGSIHLKFKHIVVYENSLDDFDIGHCPIKVKVMA